jgi:hypothetical protein
MQMSDTAKAGNQSRTQDTSGGNIVGKGPTKHRLHQPPKFQGKSGTPDNQSTSRPKGST